MGPDVEDELAWTKRGAAAVRHMRIFTAVMTAVTSLFLMLSLASATGLGGGSGGHVLEWLGLPPADGQSIALLAMMTFGGMILHGVSIGLLKFFRLG
ncbi:hypothetical protein UCD39_05505 [Nitrospirillum sp. BR 11752]|uniref:hypothetical protein n=1 Tax=Nitrospirillum sp. BR 11752 TaxID=3104293 RepID=UPI002EBAE181|nr:hypothetical protein [Nitrospirillum sp. BR 11752]